MLKYKKSGGRGKENPTTNLRTLFYHIERKELLSKNEKEIKNDNKPAITFHLMCI